MLWYTKNDGLSLMEDVVRVSMLSDVHQSSETEDGEDVADEVVYGELSGDHPYDEKYYNCDEETNCGPFFACATLNQSLCFDEDHPDHSKCFNDADEVDKHKIVRTIGCDSL